VAGSLNRRCAETLRCTVDRDVVRRKLHTVSKRHGLAHVTAPTSRDLQTVSAGHGIAILRWDSPLYANSIDFLPPNFHVGPMTQKGPVNPRGAIRDGALRARSISARTLIAIAMGISPARVLGPDWIDSERYQISAVLTDANARSLRTRLSGSASRNEEFQVLLREEIVRRFGMEFQQERRETSGFAARLPPSGSIKAQRSKTLEGARFKESGTPVLNVRRTLEVRGATMPEFLEWLERFWLRAPVVAISAVPYEVWDFRIRWTTADQSSLFQSVKEKVGIEITPATVSPEYLIIKRIDRPEIGEE
jgi:uncharacterized protein (TIGR03435 family)